MSTTVPSTCRIRRLQREEYVDARKPTWQEINNCETVSMTEEKEWDPYCTFFEEQELVAETNETHPLEDNRISRKLLSISTNESQESIASRRMLSSVSVCLNDDEFLQGLMENVEVTTDVKRMEHPSD